MDNKSNAGRVQSIERAFSIVEMLKVHQELGISELSSLLSLDRSTVHRLLATLRSLGYVNQNKSNLKYSNSLKFFDLGHSVVRSLGLSQIAKPFMARLANQTGEGVNIAVMESYAIAYIEKIESQSTIRVNLPLGAYMPAYCTGLGKMLLAALPEEEIRENYRNSSETAARNTIQCHEDLLQLRRYTANTITDLEALCTELAQTRERGYSIDDEEYVEGLYCIAAPIRNYRGATIAAMSVALAKIMGRDIKQEAQNVIPKLLAAARELSCALGYLP
ncbi:IclR family transcriptional regulator [Pyramidobacter sp. YE332]|uniref:IclR family transcriptional regulator n=1 Tax=unclassified Pyramidobacter TaxID=2632171 RepID=UPI00098F6722|nr:MULTISPECIES: IclR family transcriptional regulator [unclassified Pyramidobacter]OON87862.1 hypothetical protein B0D78_09295 [Pyramidobacter sp. C12-8]WOL39522.1 IclR family transcriptional regulator [Pyramidobacter sp. YE332]